jgi:predicted acylesterase/phospholipase RssA
MGRQRLGVAISGGSAKLLTAMGAVAALEEAGVEPAAVAGCSMGAIIAALWKAGYGGGEIRELFGSFNFRDTVYWWQLLTGSHQKDYRYGRFSTRKMKQRFFDRYVPRPGGQERPFALYVYAFDLSTGLPIFWPDTELPLDMKEAVLASMCLVPYFTPYKVKDAEGRAHYLADGGYFTPVPAEVLKERARCDTVIGIACRDARRPWHTEIRCTREAVQAMDDGRWRVSERRALPYVDHLIVIPSDARGFLFNARTIAEAYSAGYETTSRWLAENRAALAGVLP